MQLRDRALKWSDGQYIVAIAKLKAIANSNILPEGYDDTFTGDKSTECNHGLCSEEIAPTTAIYRQNHHKCPLDMRDETSSSGCFYTCAHFKAHKYKVNIKQLIKDFTIKD